MIKNFVFSCLKGIAIGSGAILPGISSGVFCVIFGIYEKLLDCVLNFFSDIKKNIRFLFPIVVGCIIGVLIFSKFLNYGLYYFPIQTKCIFIGLILGSIPALVQEIHNNNKSKKKTLDIVESENLDKKDENVGVIPNNNDDDDAFKPRYLLFFFATLCLGIACIFLEKFLSVPSLESDNFLYFVLCGFTMSVRGYCSRR